MRLGKYLSSLTKPELEELKEQLNLTESEAEVFKMLSVGKTNPSMDRKRLIEELSINRYSSIALVMVSQNIRQEK